MSGPFGIPIHEPDVVLTDVGLAVLGVVLGWRLAAAPGSGMFRKAGVVIMFALASAALWGAVFHAFFLAGTATPAGFTTWMLVAFSILVVAASLLDLGLRTLVPRLPRTPRRVLVAAYAAAFAVAVLLVDESFSTIVRFYAPVVVLFLIVATGQAVRGRSASWTLIAASFALSLLAAVLQQARVSIHPAYFDHNALYHVLQGAALVLLYLGFRRAPPR